jgi:hypothetical protein
MIWERFAKRLLMIGVAALALAALATGVNARDLYEGKFTLAVETHWGDVTLPAGDYTLSLPSTSFPYTLYIHGKTVDAIVMAIAVDEAVVSRSPRLDLTDVTATPTVQKFEAPGLGMTFVYWTPKQRPLGNKEASQKPVPQPASVPQVTLNKFVEVHTTAR